MEDSEHGGQHGAAASGGDGDGLLASLAREVERLRRGDAPSSAPGAEPPPEEPHARPDDHDVLALARAALATADRLAEVVRLLSVQVDAYGDRISALEASIDGGATIEEGAVVGEGCSVWPGTLIRSGAVVGHRCTLGRGAYVDAGVEIGSDAKIQDRALLYAPARLGVGVFVGPGAILTNDRLPRAVGPDLRKKDVRDWAPEGVVVDDGASIGAGAVVVAGTTIGRWAMVGAGSVVTGDVAPFALVVGSPARRIGWVGRAGARLEEDGTGRLRCPLTGQGFRVVGEGIRETDAS